MTTVYFDNRSVNSSRVSGWERFAKELWSGLSTLKSDDYRIEAKFGSHSSKFSDIMRDFRLDKWSAHLTHYPTYPPSWLSTRSRNLFTLYDLTWWIYPEHSSTLGRHYYRYQAEEAIRRGAHIGTVSEASRIDIVNHFDLDPSRVSVIYPGLKKLEHGNRAQTSQRRKPYLLFVGSVEPRKNLSRLIAAFKLSGLESEFDLIVVGRVAWGHPPSGVHIYSSQTDQQLADWYANCTALVLPSTYEGFGLPIIEAFSFGKPVFISDIPVFREVAGELATYFNPLDEESIAESIVVGLNGISSFETSSAVNHANYFTWEQCALDHMSLYKELSQR
jgi:glycosyltransferase involved in cell wall biosynthesis